LIIPIRVSRAGAGLLWFGWFGFNAGGGFGASPIAALAVANTQIAAATGFVSFLFLDWIVKGKPSAVCSSASLILLYFNTFFLFYFSACVIYLYFYLFIFIYFYFLALNCLFDSIEFC
jgi:hypothetical protein